MMFESALRPSICLRCLARRKFTTAVVRRSERYTSTKASLSPGSSRLTSRRLISLHGSDAPQFLQGITTNTVSADAKNGLYTAFLTAQGRVLNDVFIYPTHHSPAYLDHVPASLDPKDPGFFIEVDADEAAKLVTHLKRYKLRAKLAIRLLEDDEWNVWSTWGEQNQASSDAAPVNNISPSPMNPSSVLDPTTIGCVDPRAPNFGLRLVSHASSPPAQLPPTVPLSTYTLRRILYGIPEGQREIPRETSLPQESNMDHMQGIDFWKGCYVGQELTIRTRHTGVVRKRILPVQLYPVDTTPPNAMTYAAAEEAGVEAPPPGTNLVKMESGKEGARKRSVGRWMEGMGNLGFALCRIEAMTGVRLTAGGDPWDPEMRFGAEWVRDGEQWVGGKVGVKAFVPEWLKLAEGWDLQGKRDAGLGEGSTVGDDA
ncbi:MAG: ccr4 associated factor [Piccolia ochrophora]|nr:MAG: ccr4 associated factor [Piccolia ochrophora]